MTGSVVVLSYSNRCPLVCPFLIPLPALSPLSSRLTPPPPSNRALQRKSQAGGQTARAAPLPTSFASRLEELEGPAAVGGESGSGGGGGGGKSGGDGGLGKKNASTGKGTAGGLLLTPEEYVAHVSGLKEDLEVAWAREEKVAALKVTVQV